MKKRNLFGREKFRQGITAAEHVQRAEPVRKNKKQRYEALFFKRSAKKTGSGKVVYIRKEYHERIIRIVQVIGKNNQTLFDYLDNVLAQHFAAYKDEITSLYRERNTDIY